MYNKLLNLKNLRELNNLSNKKMADKLGISKTFYWQIENGKRNLSYDMAIRISKVLKSKPDKIFYDDFKN